MQRIHKTFERLQQQQRKALIPYVTAGDPDPAVTVACLHALVEAGADIIEIGIPFSDPMAEGPVIQAAMERALTHDVSLDDVLAMVKQFRETDQTTPIILMGYLNPIETVGYEAFASAAHSAGVDGLITVDLPPEEASVFRETLLAHDIATIFLISPTTTDERIKAISALATGYVYYVSLKGVTGSSSINTEEVATRIKYLRQYIVLPITVGFGIKTPETAAAMSQVADGVVVGSALVNVMAENAGNHDAVVKQAASFTKSLRDAMI